jgi:hypothetical protein
MVGNMNVLNVLDIRNVPNASEISDYSCSLNKDVGQVGLDRRPHPRQVRRHS